VAASGVVICFVLLPAGFDCAPQAGRDKAGEWATVVAGEDDLCAELVGHLHGIGGDGDAASQHQDLLDLSGWDEHFRPILSGDAELLAGLAEEGAPVGEDDAGHLKKYFFPIRDITFGNLSERLKVSYDDRELNGKSNLEDAVSLVLKRG